MFRACTTLATLCLLLLPYLVGCGGSSKTQFALLGATLRASDAMPSTTAPITLTGREYFTRVNSQDDGGSVTYTSRIAIYSGSLPSPLPDAFDPAAANLIRTEQARISDIDASTHSLEIEHTFAAAGDYSVIYFSTVSFAREGAPQVFLDSAGITLTAGDCGEGVRINGQTPIVFSDSNNQTDFERASVEIASGLVGQPYSQSIAPLVTGSTAPLTFRLVARDGLAGINLGSSGVFTGTSPSAGVGTHRTVVEVTDSCTPPRTALFTVIITIQADPNFCDTFTNNLPATLPGGVVGASYTTTLSSAGGNAPRTWNLESGTLPPGLSITGEQLAGTPTTPGTYDFTLRVTDSCPAGARFESKATQIVITGTVSGCGKPFTTDIYGVQEEAAVGLLYSATLHIEGGVPPLTWSLDANPLPDGLNLSPFGTIAGIPTIATPGPPFVKHEFRVKVVDSCDPPQEHRKIFRMLILGTGNCPQFDIREEPIPNAYVDEFYQFALEPGGIRPYTFDFGTTGTFPPGIGISPDGVLSGRPSAAGTFTFEVIANDTCPVAAGGQQVDTAMVTLVVIDASCPPLEITTASLPPGNVGSPYSAFITVTGGQAPFTFDDYADGLPAGLSLNAGTGEISGTPTTGGGFPISIYVEDSCLVPQEALEEYSLFIDGAGCPGMEVDATDPPSAAVGTPYSFTFEAFGGQGALTWSVYTGGGGGNPLPPGITLNSDTGELSGTASVAGDYFFDVFATDECDPPQQAFKSVHLIVL